MFDAVSAPRPARRPPAALALAVLAHTAVLAALAWVFDPTEGVAETRAPEPPERYVEIRLPSPAGGAPAPRAAVRAAPRVPPRTNPVAAVVPDPAVPALPDPTVAPLAVADAGDGGGPEAGAGGTGGCVGPDCAGTGPCVGPDCAGTGACLGPDCGGAAPRVVHWSEVVPTRRVSPEFPALARAAGLTEASCAVRIDIDGAGVPARVEPLDCPEAFQRATVDAALRWRFQPLPDGLPARFTLRIEYRTR